MNLSKTNLQQITREFEKELLNPGRFASMRRRLLISPRLADHWLVNHNHKNRNISKPKWEKIACDIREGRWRYNGVAILFGSDGELLNGQHRLLACVNTEIPLDTDVVFGLDPDVFSTIDIGEARRAGEIAQVSGVENANSSCAIAKLLLIHQTHGIPSMNNPTAYPTKTQVVNIVLNDPKISAVATHIHKWSGRHILPGRIMGFCFYLFSEQDADLADTFFDALCRGVNLKEGSPVYYLRERLQANRAAKAKLPAIEIIALCFKAWKAYRDGLSVYNLRWRRGGDAPEKFPSIV